MIKRQQSRQTRLAEGRESRNRLSRVDFGQVNPGKRNFDPMTVLRSAEKGRVRELLPLKYKRMSASPFAFFRGSVGLMAADLARLPSTGLTVQLCGDAHVQNLGSFSAPDGRTAFDINDFDGTIPGPWEWDVKHMAASLALAGTESGHGQPQCAAAVTQFAISYCTLMEALAEEPVLAAARHQIHRPREAQAVSAALQQAEQANPADLLRKYTELNSKKQVQFKSDGPYLRREVGSRHKQVLGAIPLYRKSLPPERLHLFDFFEPKDVCFKVVGTGSVGLRAYVVLMEGNGAGDPLFLQIKQEVRSAYAPYLKASLCRHQGQRVVEGQRRIQPLSDLLLGWTRIADQDYLVRQLNDHKGSVNIGNLAGDGLRSLAEIAGELLARGHARSGDALAIKGYVGAPHKIVKAIVQYGLNYAAMVHADFETFQKSIAAGKIKIAPAA